MGKSVILTLRSGLFIIVVQLVFIVIQTTEGRKNLGSIHVYVTEILRVAQDDTNGLLIPNRFNRFDGHGPISGCQSGQHA